MLDEKKKIDLVKHHDRLAARRPYWKKRNRYYYEDQFRYFRFLVPKDLSVLELGCGTGDLLNTLEPKRGVGIDFSPEMINIAKSQYPNLEFRESDIEKLKNWGETFDILIMADVIGHLQDIEETLRLLKAFCKPTTRLIISYYNFLWEPILKIGEKFALKTPQQYQNWLSAKDIWNLLFLTEYQVVKTESRLLIPKKIPILSNVLNRYLSNMPGIRNFCLCRYIVARPLNLVGKQKLSTSILIPCKNEKGNIKAAIERIPEFGSHQEIIFVEGGSNDGTRAEIQSVIKEFPHKDIKLVIQEGKGKGDAVRKGFAAAKSDILMILDGDLTMPPEDLIKFYRAIEEDRGEFINGCRLVYPMEKEAMRFLNMIGNKFFSMMFSWLLNHYIRDTLCGTKALSKKSYDEIVKNRSYFGNFDPFGDFDLLFGASKLNLKIVEIPIRYRARTYGETQIRRFSHGLLLIKMCFFAARRLKWSI